MMLIVGPKRTPEHNYKGKPMSATAYTPVIEWGTYTDSKTLTEHKVPVLCALCNKKRRHDEDRTRDDKRDPEVAYVE